MIDIKQLLPYYPKPIAENASFHKHILKEYVELLALEHLSQTHYAPKLVFIGGTCLRLVHGIDRFSEDLDFDCKNLSYDEFIQMTDDLIDFLRGNGLTAEVRDKENTRLTAYRRNIYFPGLLFEMNLTGHREECFLMKIEDQDQGVSYVPETTIVNRNGFLFPLGVPSKSVMLSMKVSSINCFQSILFVSSQQTFSRLGIVQTLRDLPSALGLSKTFLFRADFRAEGGSNVSQSERKRCLCLLPSQRNVSEANAVHCNRLTIGKMPK